jgi:NDP-sugar pyrophosphorylase family protein
MLEAFDRTVAEQLDVHGEFYVSLAYRPLLADGRRVEVYPIDTFMQWGTPDDLADYLTWSRAFAALADAPSGRAVISGTTLVPAAGAGSRFADAGTTTPKPAIPVSGRPMLEQVLRSLPASDRTVVVTRPEVAAALEAAEVAHETMLLPEVTDGQARTVALAVERLGLTGALTVASSDGALLHDPDAFAALWRTQPDLVVWVAEDYRPAAARPTSYGWVSYDDAGAVQDLAVKQALTPADGHRLGVITGTFTWREASGFSTAFDRLVERDGRVNGELYADSLVEDALALELRVVAFPVRAWLSWGTPYELRSFQYWQEGLSRWSRHPYSSATDPMVPAAARLLAPVQTDLVPVPPAAV